MEFDTERIKRMTSGITPQWLAGFFDGEGCVSVDMYKDSASVKVSITQSEPIILLAIGFKFGAVPDPKGNKNGKPGYSVRWCGKGTIPVLEYIKDFVIVKHESVLLGLEIAKLTAETGVPCDYQAKKRRFELGERISKLNERGKNAEKENVQ